MKNKTPHILAAALGAQKRWVNWRIEERNGKSTKVPYRPGSERMASSTDPKTWGTYEEAANSSEKVGIIFTPELILLGIDIDHCLVDGAIQHEQADAIRTLIDEADTYTEVSPSKTGLHLYLSLSEPLPLVANRHGNFECYTAGRFFTVTNEPFEAPRALRTVSSAEALRLLSIIGYPWKKDAKPVPAPTTTYLDAIPDQQLLDRMLQSRSGADIQLLLNGDMSAYGNDPSRADMALLSHLAFWCGKNSEQMERLWMASKLGGREKTTKRKDYRDRSIKAAIALCSEVYDPSQSSKGESEMAISDPKLNLLYTLEDKRRKYYKNTENISRLINNHPEFTGMFRFDEYKNIIERKLSSGAWRDFRDSDILEVQTRISVLFTEFAHVSKEMVFDAIIKVATDHSVDTGADYLRSLVWDKVPRLDSWISKVYHTEDNVYHRSIGSNWLKGLVKRVIEPGCKFDYVLVLEGAQGIRKSTSLAILGGSLGHVETTMSTETKDFFMQFLGNAVVEFSEGETLSRTEVKRMKALITVTSDKFREPYGKTTVAHPRRCVFAMTTNQQEYLKDETGNRRWLPVSVQGVADTEWLEENREQLLAEAYHRVVEKQETTYEFPDEEMERQQSMRRIQSANMEQIVNWYFSLSPEAREEGVNSYYVFQHALNGGFGGRPMTRTEEMDISDVLRSTLFLEQRRGMQGGVRTRKWYPTKKTEPLLAEAQSLLELGDF